MKNTHDMLPAWAFLIISPESQLSKELSPFPRERYQILADEGPLKISSRPLGFKSWSCNIGTKELIVFPRIEPNLLD